MKFINLSNKGVLEYCGNRIGFVKNDTAFVDEMFKKADVSEFLEKENGLKVEWQSDIYERLIQGEIEHTDIAVLKNCRLYQLKATTDICMRYIGYDDLKEKGFTEPNIKDYKIVYDGNIGTNDLESIYEKFDNIDKPEEIENIGIYISDVIELYDENSSEFYYVNPQGFEKLEHFNEPIFEPIRETKKENEKVIEQTVKEPQKAVKSPETPKAEKPNETQSESDEEFQVETFKITM